MSELIFQDILTFKIKEKVHVVLDGDYVENYNPEDVFVVNSAIAIIKEDETEVYYNVEHLATGNFYEVNESNLQHIS